MLHSFFRIEKSEKMSRKNKRKKKGLSKGDIGRGALKPKKSDEMVCFNPRLPILLVVFLEP